MLTASAGARRARTSTRSPADGRHSRALGAGGDHPIVAGQLALDAQPPRDPPRGGMEPVHARRRPTPASASGNRSGRRAPAREGSPPVVCRPPRCRRWPEPQSRDGGCRTPPARCARGFAAGAPGDGRPCGRHTRAAAASIRRPARRRAARKTPHAPVLRHQAKQHAEHAGDIDAGNRDRPRETRRAGGAAVADSTLIARRADASGTLDWRIGAMSRPASAAAIVLAPCGIATAHAGSTSDSDRKQEDADDGERPHE